MNEWIDCQPPTSLVDTWHGYLCRCIGCWWCSLPLRSSWSPAVSEWTFNSSGCWIAWAGILGLKPWAFLLFTWKSSQEFGELTEKQCRIANLAFMFATVTLAWALHPVWKLPVSYITVTENKVTGLDSWYEDKYLREGIVLCLTIMWILLYLFADC